MFFGVTKTTSISMVPIREDQGQRDDVKHQNHKHDGGSPKF